MLDLRDEVLGLRRRLDHIILQDVTLTGLTGMILPHLGTDLIVRVLVADGALLCRDQCVSLRVHVRQL